VGAALSQQQHRSLGDHPRHHRLLPHARPRRRTTLVLMKRTKLSLGSRASACRSFAYSVEGCTTSCGWRRYSRCVFIASVDLLNFRNANILCHHY
jgi:hypothetical protein